MHKLVVKYWCAFVFLLFLSIVTVAQTVPVELYNGLRWRLIGPFRGGRTVAVAGFPGNATTFYFGSVGGGLWQTRDVGVVWKPIFDGRRWLRLGRWRWLRRMRRLFTWGLVSRTFALIFLRVMEFINLRTVGRLGGTLG